MLRVGDVPLDLLKRKAKVHVSKSLNIQKAWNAINSAVAEHIGGVDYIPIPYLVDAYAYQIGSIFVQENSETQCFCAAGQLKLLGPIRDFLVPGKSSSRWLASALPVIKSTKDHVNFRVEMGNGKHELEFSALDCYFLDMASDMKIEREVTIDRSTHEDLSSAQWFGLITAAAVSCTSDITMKRSHIERKFYIGEKPHTILFKYVICKINRAGGVYETSSHAMECKWLPVSERNMDVLPLTDFVSQSSRIKT